MNAPATGFPPARVTPHAGHAFGGIWRLTVSRSFTRGHWLVLAGMLVLLVLFSIPAAPNRAAAARGFLPWAAGFYVCFLVPLLSFISAAGAMRDELKAGTVDYVFTRPVRRPAFVVFRYLSQVGCAQIDFLIALGVVAAIGLYHDVPGLWQAVPRLLLAQALLISAFSAFGFLAATITSRYVIVGLLYGAIVEMGVGNVPTQLNRISMVRHGIGIVQPVLGEMRIGMGGPLAAAPLSATASVGVLLALSLALVAVTAALFSFKELAGSAGREA